MSVDPSPHVRLAATVSLRLHAHCSNNEVNDTSKTFRAVSLLCITGRHIDEIIEVGVWVSGWVGGWVGE